MLEVTIWSVIFIFIIAVCIVGFAHEEDVIKWEDKMIKKIIRWIVRKLKSSRRFMQWLYEPSLSEQIAAEFDKIRIRVRNHWRV